MKTYLTLISLICMVTAFGAETPKGKSKKEAKTQKAVEVAKELKVEELKKGSGIEAVAGKEITVHYTGTLTSGKKFDSSVDRNEPFKFILGAGQVIAGWDKGIAGVKEKNIAPMRVGGKRKLIIPPDMAYGQNGVAGVIPPDSTLVFEVELLGVSG